MHYSLLPGHLLHMFLLWGEQVALGRLLSVALHEVPHKGKRITLSSKGSEGQVTVGGGGAVWSQPQRSPLPVVGIAYRGNVIQK